MPPIILYLLKSVICSGILYTYYRFAFYNRPHHQWSRFFLIGSVVISLVLPIVKIDLPPAVTSPDSVVRLMNVVAINESEFEEKDVAIAPILDVETALMLLYGVVSCVFILSLIQSLARINQIHRTSPKWRYRHCNMVMTEEKDAPFSFLTTIFWNARIDLHSSSGEKILEHEMEHVRQLHSLDRMLMNVVLALFWCNPFFWLVRKELIVVHEFIADRKAIGYNNPGAFSEMVLLCAFPGKSFGVTSTFFHSSIKRRLTMLNTGKPSRFNRSGMWLMLPFMFMLIAGFSLRKSQADSVPAAADFVLVVDAGHGGGSSGVVAQDGTKEKDITLAIAKKIEELNTSDRIRIIMTRESDDGTSLQERVEKARSMQAGAFLSIHISSNSPSQSGIQLMMTKNASAYAGRSQLLGSMLARELNKVYKVDGALRKGAEKGVWVLDAPEINYPSLLIECGNIHNPDDLRFITSPANQEKIARQILNAVSQFAGGSLPAAAE